MGEVEIWKDIEGYEELYQVSNWGQVKSLERSITSKNGRKSYIVPERIRKPNKDRYGYFVLSLSKDNKKKYFTVHKLVASAFIPNDNPTEKTEINHIDENKENNHVNNLCWCSHIENCNYGTRNERVSKAIKKPILQYTNEGEFIKEFDSAKSASIELNIYASSITACCKKKQNQCGGYIWRYKETTT